MQKLYKQIARSAIFLNLAMLRCETNCQIWPCYQSWCLEKSTSRRPRWTLLTSTTSLQLQSQANTHSGTSVVQNAWPLDQLLVIYISSIRPSHFGKEPPARRPDEVAILKSGVSSSNGCLCDLYHKAHVVKEDLLCILSENWNWRTIQSWTTCQALLWYSALHP